MTDRIDIDARKEYAERDHMALCGYYVRHVSAMTAEGFHAKSDIAAELAWRDREIDNAITERNAFPSELRELEQGYARRGELLRECITFVSWENIHTMEDARAMLNRINAELSGATTPDGGG